MALYTLGWRPIGAPKRRWQLQNCGDIAEAARIAAGLADFDGGARWRVYNMATVPVGDGLVKLVRKNIVAEGVVLPDRDAGDVAQLDR